MLIHGGGFGSYDGGYSWALNLEKLGSMYHVLAFDKLGMGLTDNPKRFDDYTITATWKHAHDFIVAKGMDSVSLVGHSRGGFLATRLALEYPDLVEKLVVVDSRTLAPDDPSVPLSFYDDLEKNPPDVETPQTVLRETVANSYSTKHITEDFTKERLNIANSSNMRKVRLEWGREGRKLFLKDLDEKRRETIQMINQGKLKAPTLIVWAHNDPSAPVKLAWDLFGIISAKVPRTELHILSESGHYSYREHPDEFNKVVSAFIEHG